VLAEVAGEEAPTSKVQIGALIMKHFKEQKTGNVKFTFRTPIMDGLSLPLCLSLPLSLSSSFFVFFCAFCLFIFFWYFVGGLVGGWVGGRLGVGWREGDAT